MILLFGILVTVITMRQILVARVDVRVQSQLEQEVREFRSLSTGIDPITGRPFGGRVEPLFDTFLARNVPAAEEILLTFAGGELYRVKAFTDVELGLEERADLLNRWADLQATETGTLSTDNGDVRYLAVPVSANDQVRGSFVVAALLDRERAEIDEAVRIAALVGIAALLIGSLVAYLAAGRVLGPLRELTDTARAIEETDLTRRIEVTGEDELAELGHTFNAMLARLERSFDSQKNLVRNVSHELRTPLTIVRGHLELMGDDPGEREETVELVTDELDRIGRLVDDLLILARADSPDFIRREEVDVNRLITDLGTKARTLGEREWSLVEAVGMPTVPADRQRLTQALLNLIDNAVQQTGEGDPIEVGAQEEPGGEIRFWVADSGPGIELSERDRLFERFERGGRGRSYAGTGLGLAIVRAIATGHRGRVEVADAALGGAEISVVIPIGPGDPHPAYSDDG